MPSCEVHNDKVSELQRCSLHFTLLCSERRERIGFG